MRRVFKGTLVVFAVGAGLALTAVSCRESSTEPQLRAPDPLEVSTDRKVAELRAATDWMGDFHTGALTYVQTQLAAAKQTARTTIDRCKVASKAFKDYTKAFRRNGAPLTLPADFEAGLGCETGLPVGSQATVLIDKPDEVTPRHDLSTQAQAYLTRIESAVDASVTDDQFVATVYSIEAEAAATLPAAEATAVFGTGAIAVSSAEYWGDNLDGWSTGGGVEVPLAYSMGIQPLSALSDRISPLGKFILKADIAGAISSFLKDWFTGVASVEKAAIMGAAASVIAGVARLL
jgi:hypothetical protein